MTLHIFARIGVGRNKREFYLKRMKREVRERWINTDVLIIDEISMINAKTFDLLHEIASKVRLENEELFGGMQVFACGDLLQLKPIEGDYIFKSKVWKKYMSSSMILTKCYRQKEDPLFFNALNEIRLGEVSEAAVQYLMRRHFTSDNLIDNSYLRLFFLRGNVFKYNELKMADLRGKAIYFKAKDNILDKSITLTSFQIPPDVTVKLGAVVMLLKNINVEEGLCNGAVGKN
ncbi:ATP-dependent DNA helicase PIF1-like [Hydra vulgaris]|uniref:ATP-dependent DNA helicase PIF1-like n=1 Tax=Hydra vulgaris TaxID=6087 RepID=UPI0002B4BE9D|nr:ATP-dependent DNA helicase PIF1-like [Hydra vulgaris]